MQRYLTIAKISLEKKFLETLSFVLPAKTTVGLIEWSGVANFYAPLHSEMSLTDSGSEILQQHSAPKYSETKIRLDEKFKPIFILLNSLV